jgi:hypothetical protein
MSNEQAQEQHGDQQTTPKSKIKSRREIEGATAPPRRPTPSSLLVYVAIVLFTFGYGALIPGEPSLAFDQRLAITVFFRLMLIFLLVNRSVVGWVVALLFEAMQIILVALLIESPGGPKVWGMVFLHTAALALLLTGATRQHIWSWREESLAAQRAEQARQQEEQAQAGESSSSSSST